MKKKKIGLALGGGGIHGITHIGVIKILEENNIPIDFIAGTSIGALIGGFYAATKDISKIEELAKKVEWKEFLPLIDPDFKQGLIGGEKIKNFIENFIDKINFDDCKIPFVAVATDIKTSEVVYINDGEVSSAIRASLSFPLIFKPTNINGKLLSDGGLVMPVPVETLREMGADIIIAVNLYGNNETNNDEKASFYKIAIDSINIMSRRLSAHDVEKANIVINPNFEKMLCKKLICGDELISRGEEATKKLLPQIKKLLK